MKAFLKLPNWLFIAFLMGPFGENLSMAPPKAPKKNKVLTHHGDKRIDPYYWLNERENPAVINYLKEENLYTKEKMKPHQKLLDNMYKEMISRLKDKENEYPYQVGNYNYYRKFQKNLNYPIHYRIKRVEGAKEEEILNPNKLAEGTTYFNLTSISISPDEKKLAYAVDTEGRNFFTVFIRDLETEKITQTTIEKATSNFTWANDNQTLFYTKQHPENLRWEKVFRYSLKEGSHQLVFHEKDEKFWVYVRKSKTDRLIFLESEATISNETYIINPNRPLEEPKLFLSRGREHLYYLIDGGDRLFIKTNFEAKNFRFMETEYGQSSQKDWKELLPHRDDILLEEVESFKDFLVFKERNKGLVQYRVLNRNTKNQKLVPFSVNPATAYMISNYEYDTDKFRFSLESLSLPESLYEYDLNKGSQKLLKQTKIGGNYNSDNYETNRIFVTSRDGVKIPVSLVYKKGIKKDGNNPLIIYAYGAYGSNVNPYFEQEVISLLDRGFVYAVANIRGGSEMGRLWYEDGKLLKKKNSFFDFIDVSEFLIKEKYTAKKRVYGWGMSAGGLLMGAVVNMRPDLYNGILADVPFVDALTTMLDPSLPLTVGEYDEWGNPEEKEFYDYIKSYSPYDNIKAQDYPHILVTTGFNDSQVQYWEPAKWVAKLRDTKTDSNLLLLKTNMDTGHGGSSGRLESLKESAFSLSFIASLEGHKE